MKLLISVRDNGKVTTRDFDIPLNAFQVSQVDAQGEDTSPPVYNKIGVLAKGDYFQMFVNDQRVGPSVAIRNFGENKGSIALTSGGLASFNELVIRTQSK